MSKKIDWDIVKIIVLIALLLLFIYGFNYIEPWVYRIYPVELGSVGQYNLPKLTGQFLKIAFISCGISSVLGVAIGMFCVTSIGREFKPVIERISTVGRTFPTLAMLYLMRPILGQGEVPAIVALVVSSTLPIIISTIAGIDNINPTYIEVAKGMGMSKIQILKNIQLPLAFPVVISGIRLALIMCIGATTLASSTGAGGLGLLLSTAMSTYNTIYIIECTIPICLMVMIADKSLRKLEDHYHFG